MSFRRKPNPNRNFPLYCPWCAGEQLFPSEESDFAWTCQECSRVFEVKYFGQDDPPARPAPAPSTAQANRESLNRHVGSPILGAAGGPGPSGAPGAPGAPGVQDSIGTHHGFPVPNGARA